MQDRLAGNWGTSPHVGSRGRRICAAGSRQKFAPWRFVRFIGSAAISAALEKPPRPLDERLEAPRARAEAGPARGSHSPNGARAGPRSRCPGPETGQEARIFAGAGPSARHLGEGYALWSGERAARLAAHPKFATKPVRGHPPSSVRRTGAQGVGHSEPAEGRSGPRGGGDPARPGPARWATGAPPERLGPIAFPGSKPRRPAPSAPEHGRAPARAWALVAVRPA